MGGDDGGHDDPVGHADGFHPRIHRATTGRGGAGSPLLLSGLFLGGYLLAWSGFSVVAAVFQWGLYHGVLLDGHTLRVAPVVGGIVLVAAGAFQLSGAKDACLSQCRAPLGYFVTEWRDGMSGAAWMGATSRRCVLHRMLLALDGRALRRRDHVRVGAP